MSLLSFPCFSFCNKHQKRLGMPVRLGLGNTVETYDREISWVAFPGIYSVIVRSGWLLKITQCLRYGCRLSTTKTKRMSLIEQCSHYIFEWVQPRSIKRCFPRASSSSKSVFVESEISHENLQSFNPASLPTPITQPE
jgi:hypothetical protein